MHNLHKKPASHRSFCRALLGALLTFILSLSCSQSEPAGDRARSTGQRNSESIASGANTGDATATTGGKSSLREGLLTDEELLGEDVGLDIEEYVTQEDLPPDEPESEADEQRQTPKVNYPMIVMKATGNTHCRRNMATRLVTMSQLGPKLMAIKKAFVKLDCNKFRWYEESKCESKTGESASKAMGLTHYFRPVYKNLRAKRDAGQYFPSYNIYTNKVSNKGAVYHFSSELPVFPWPAVESRYADLKGGKVHSWKAKVTGAANLNAEVQVRRTGGSGNRIKLQYKTILNGGGNRSLYSDFPIPQTQTFTIDMAKKQIVEVSSHHIFSNSKCKDNGNTLVNFKLCHQTLEGKTTNYPCPF